MKRFHLLFSALISISISSFSMAEIRVSINEFPNTEGENMLFRGYKNLLEITTIGEELEYTIGNKNLKMSKVAPSENPNVKRYWLAVGTEKTASLSFVKKGEKIAFLAINFKIGNIPAPILSLEAVENGGVVSKTTSSVTIGLPERVRLKAHYKVLQTCITIGDKTETTSSSSLSDLMRALLESGKSGEMKFWFDAKYKA